MMYMTFPIVSWVDGSGNFTVSTVSGVNASAYGPDLAKCHIQIKKYIAWKYNDESYGVEPDFHNPTLDFFMVPIRSGYQVDDGFFPDEERLMLKVPAVWGSREDGLVVCNLPLIGTTFHCREASLLETLVPTQVQSSLNGKEPIELSRYLVPTQLEVDSINVRIKNKSSRDSRRVYGTIETVAARLGSREHKSTFSQAWQQEQVVEALAAKLDSAVGNLLILGNGGVGKSTLLVNAIRRMEKQEADRLKDTTESLDDDYRVSERFWFTSADRLIAGMQYLGQWEGRLEEVIKELAAIQGVLCFDNLQQLIRLGGQEPTESIASFLAPFIQNNEIRVVIEATKAELDSCRRLLPGFDALFDLFEVTDFTREQARAVLRDIGNQQKQNHKIDFEMGAADLTYRLFKRFFPYQSFPGKCVIFWRKLFMDFRARQLEQKKRHDAVDSTIEIDHVISAFVDQTGLPEALIRDEFIITADEVFSFFQSRIKGQETACRSVTNVVTTLKAGLNDPARPIGVQLFCGPTGVGKTEMAKTLAEYMFGSSTTNSGQNQRLIRLDMSEYAGFGAADRLLMQPNGEPSKLIQQIRERPFVVLLLDEIEKAAAEVFDVLMGVFDEGRLTDRWGRTTDFRSTIIIMTSNLGVRHSAPIGFENEAPEVYEKEIRRFFRPEFYNRFDAVVPFNPLGQESIRKITELELQKVEKRIGFTSRHLKLIWEEAVVDFLSETGFDKRYGARPLQRTVESLVVAPLARLLAEEPTIQHKKIQLQLNESRGVQTVDVSIL